MEIHYQRPWLCIFGLIKIGRDRTAIAHGNLDAGFLDASEVYGWGCDVSFLHEFQEAGSEGGYIGEIGGMGSHGEFGEELGGSGG